VLRKSEGDDPIELAGEEARRAVLPPRDVVEPKCPPVASLAQVIGDRLELRAEISAGHFNGADDRNADERREKAVFDGGSSGFV
jgi:hypothetical protein